MTKREQIAALLKENKNYEEIAVLVGSTRGYVSNIAMDLKRPGCLYVSVCGWNKRNPGRLRKYRKNNPEKISRLRKIILDFHQQRTKTTAHNHHKSWTTKDMEYLEQYGKEKTIHELALELGRSYMGVQMFAFRMGIDLRGDKVGAGATRFIGAYGSKLIEPKAIQV